MQADEALTGGIGARAMTVDEVNASNFPRTYSFIRYFVRPDTRDLHSKYCAELMICVSATLRATQMPR